MPLRASPAAAQNARTHTANTYESGVNTAQVRPLADRVSAQFFFLVLACYAHRSTNATNYAQSPFVADGCRCWRSGEVGRECDSWCDADTKAVGLGCCAAGAWASIE